MRFGFLNTLEHSQHESYSGLLDDLREHAQVCDQDSRASGDSRRRHHHRQPGHARFSHASTMQCLDLLNEHVIPTVQKTAT